MIKENKRSGWALAGVILTGLLVFTLFSSIFRAIIIEDIDTIFATMFLTLFMGMSFVFALIGYIKRNPTFLLVSSILNSIYSFLCLIGFIFIIYGMIYLRGSVAVTYSAYVGIFVLLMFLVLLALIFIVFLVLSSYLGYFNQRKLNLDIKEDKKQKDEK